jgi:hypothetical protein
VFTPAPCGGVDAASVLAEAVHSVRAIPCHSAVKYDARCFADAGIALNFLKSTVSPYQQFQQAPVPFLSIVDVLMFNDETAISRMLTEFELL